MGGEEVDKEEKLTALIPPEAFINVFETGDPGTVEYEVVQAQRQHTELMRQWEKTLPIVRSESPMGMEWRDQEG
jgi:hypothetical protein